MFLQQVRSSVGGKVLKKYSKNYLESIKFENQGIKIRS